MRSTVFPFLFRNGPSVCLNAQDTNDDGRLGILDPIRGLTFVFTSGPAPPPPFPECGVDATDDSVDCAEDYCP